MQTFKRVKVPLLYVLFNADNQKWNEDKINFDETEDGTGNAKHATRGDVEEQGGFEVACLD